MAIFPTRRRSSGEPTETEIRRLLLREFGEESADWLWQTDAARRVVKASEGFAHACGCDAVSLNGMPFLQVLAGPSWETGDFATGVSQVAEKLKARKSFYDLRFPVNVKSEERWWEIAARPRFDERGRFCGYVGVGSDVTQQRASADQINRMARFDGLTGLPNRHLIVEALARACFDADKYGGSCCAAVIAITNISQVKAALGYQEADHLLSRIAVRLERLMNPETLVGHLATGDFVVVWHDARNRNAVERLSASLLAAVRGEASAITHVDVELGQAFHPADAPDAQQLLSLALERAYADDDERPASRLSQTASGDMAATRRDVILAHGASAETGITALIDDHRLRLHNNPPDTVAQEELKRLERLRDELRELIDLAGKGGNIQHRTSRLKSLVDSVFKFSQDTGELMVAGAKPLFASVPLAYGTLVLLQAICAPGVGNILAPGAALAVVAGHYGLKVRRADDAASVD